MPVKYLKWTILLISLLILLGVVFILSLTLGEIEINVSDIFSAYTTKEGIEYTILSKIRLPRTLLAFAIGGALSLSGALLQGIYRNPLVEPYTMGISGGAAFGVALTIVLGLNVSLGSFMLPTSGFVGALITVFLVYFLSLKNGALSINRMLLIGVMISFVASSSMMFLMSVTSAENLHSIIFWMMGSLNEPNNGLITIAFVASVLGLIVSYFFVTPLNALRLGEAKTMHLGINPAVTIRILFIIASLITGICVSVAGIIGFVGLIIPHLIRIITGSDNRILLVSSYLGGSVFLIISDVIARTIIAPNELPIGVITGMIGGIVFIVALSKLMKKS